MSTKKNPAAQTAPDARKLVVQHEPFVELGRIHPDPNNCRLRLGVDEEAKLQELADNIAQLGLSERAEARVRAEYARNENAEEEP
jgi:hypothetical protein